MRIKCSTPKSCIRSWSFTCMNLRIVFSSFVYFWRYLEFIPHGNGFGYSTTKFSCSRMSFYLGNYSSFAIELWIHINWNSHRALTRLEILCDHSSAKQIFKLQTNHVAKPDRCCKVDLKISLPFFIWAEMSNQKYIIHSACWQEYYLYSMLASNYEVFL